MPINLIIDGPGESIKNTGLPLLPGNANPSIKNVLLSLIKLIEPFLIIRFIFWVILNSG